MKAAQLYRRCSCGIRNEMTVLANGKTVTVDEFTCACGVRFYVHTLWVPGAEPLTKICEEVVADG